MNRSSNRIEKVDDAEILESDYGELVLDDRLSSTNFVDNHNTDSYERKVEYTTWTGINRLFVITRPGYLDYARRHCTLSELSGALGDLGTFLPLITALAINHVNHLPQVAFGPCLFFAGLYTVMIATYFDIPVPVQPMKTIASVGLIGNYPRSQLVAAGIGMAVCMALLTASRAIGTLQRIVPVALVRGIQLGLGLALMNKGVALAYVKTASDTIVWWGLDSVATSIILGIGCLATFGNSKFPSALVLFLYGISIAIYRYNSTTSTSMTIQLGPDFDAPVIPSANDFKVAFFEMVLPQLPLTILNSVIALEKLASDLFPRQGTGVSVRRISASIAVGNGMFSTFGMLAMCHGAGGLASQHAFGARSNVSMFFLGFLKIAISLIFGSSALALLQRGVFPSSVLGIMLTFAGLSLATVSCDTKCLPTAESDRKEYVMIFLMTTGFTLARNTGIGFLAGVLTAIMLKMRSLLSRFSS